MELTNFYPKLRDGIDVYLFDDLVTFVFLSSRKRISVKITSVLIESLQWLTGSHSFDELNIKFLSLNTNFDKNSFKLFIEYLIEKNIVINKDWMSSLSFPKKYISRLEKQFEFLFDIIENAENISIIQNRIYTSKIAIIGIGSIGSWIARELAMIGFMNFLFVDFDKVSFSDISRHSFYTEKNINEYKVDVLQKELLKIDECLKIQTANIPIKIDTNIDDLLSDVDFIINSADEPYIGYTSLKLSRYCVSHKKALFIAGGFDAHLGCIGELIIPGITPCSDCYNTYFTNALKDWKPIKHPVTERKTKFGGLPSFSVFSASSGVLQILRYFINNYNIDNISKRGELNFYNYELIDFVVPKNPNCPVCKDLKIDK